LLRFGGSPFVSTPPGCEFPRFNLRKLRTRRKSCPPRSATLWALAAHLLPPSFRFDLPRRAAALCPSPGSPLSSPERHVTHEPARSAQIGACELNRRLAGPWPRFGALRFVWTPLASISSPWPRFDPLLHFEASGLGSAPYASFRSPWPCFHTPHFISEPPASYLVPRLVLKPLASAGRPLLRIEALHLASKPTASIQRPTLRFEAPRPHFEATCFVLSPSLQIGAPHFDSDPPASN